MRLAALDPRPLWRRLRQNFLLRVFSLAFAVGLWGFVNLGERDAEKTLVVPLELRNVPDSLVVTNPVTNAVDVRLRGPRTLLGTLDERRQAIFLDLSSVRPGRTEFKIDESMLTLPRGVETVRVSPAQVSLDVDRLVERSTPVVLELSGAAPDGFRLVESQVVPRRVTVSGPASVVDEMKEVHTEPVPIRARGETVTTPVPLRRDDPQVRFSPPRVDVRLVVEEIVVTKELRGIPIATLGEEGSAARVTPRSATLELRGPERILRGLAKEAVRLEVDVSTLEPGTHEAMLEAVVPEGIEVVRIDPENVQVRVPATKAKSANQPPSGGK